MQFRQPFIPNWRKISKSSYDEQERAVYGSVVNLCGQKNEEDDHLFENLSTSWI